MIRVAVRCLSNIYDGKFLLLAVNYFHIKAASQQLERFLNTALIMNVLTLTENFYFPAEKTLE